MDLDKIDLKLFEVCYPDYKVRILGDNFLYDDGEDFPNVLPRFTVYADSCFSVLIPEMNRRGFQFILEQLPDKTWLCTFIISNAMDGDTFMGVDQQPQVAISLAAEKVIDSLSCGWCHAPLDENGDCQNDK